MDKLTQNECEKNGLIWISNNKWHNNCIKCKVVREYSNKWNCYKGISKLCRDCAELGMPMSDFVKNLIETKKIWKNENGNWCRKCTDCKKDIEYKTLQNCKVNLNKLCKSCIRKHIIISNKTKNKMSIIRVGKTLPEDTKKKLSLQKLGNKNPMFEKKWTEEELEKLRKSAIKRIKRDGGIISYNTNACKFIDEYGRQNGYNFQHAMNGGEIELCGFIVDGYDKEKNVIFEYDESYHEKQMKKLKDFKRSEILIKSLQCRIIRFSEKYNKLYESFINYSVPIDI